MDVSGLFGARGFVFQVLPDRCLIDVAVGPRDDERGESLPELLIGDTDDGVVGDIAVFGKRVFDRAWIDVLAPGDNHVVFAADDEQPSRFVEVAHVPGVGHVVDDVFGAAASVGVEGQLAADEDAPDDVWPNGSAVCIEDADPVAGKQTADGLGRFAQVGWCYEGGNADLRGAVAVVEDVAVGVHEPLRQAGIQPVPDRYHRPQRRHRVSRSHGFGQIEDARKHDRHSGVTGYGVVASYLGQPDAGLATYTDMLNRAEAIVDAIHKPLIADGDTGYGGLLNVAHTVRGYEKAGVAVIQIEDQHFPKKCGHTANRHVLPAREMVNKIKVACDARSSEDFLILARTDALTSLGLDEALRRGEAYAKAGADILFIEAPECTDQMRKIGAAFDVPVLSNQLHGGVTPILPPE